MALDEEIGGPVTIDALSWHRTSVGGASATFSNFRIFMGYCESDELGDTFEDNYVPGSMTPVYSSPSMTIGSPAEEWATLELDTPFEYDGTGNLLVEIQWSSGSGSFYVYSWKPGTNRCLRGSHPGSTSGYLLDAMCQFRIELPLALQQETFGSIKALFGTP
jgi:hypothetical protein